MHPVLVKAGISTILIIIFENKTFLISKIVYKVNLEKKLILCQNNLMRFPLKPETPRQSKKKVFENAFKG